MYQIKYRVRVTLFLCVLVLGLYYCTKDTVGFCQEHEFLLKPSTACHKLLTCDDLNEIEVHEMIGLGAVKAVYRVSWREYTFALSQLNNARYILDYFHGLDMLLQYQQSPHVVNVIGYCREKRIILTEYHRHGNATELTSRLTDDILPRLKLCLSYAQILNVLHNQGKYVTVNCDSNSLDKLLSQLLVTDELSLVLNDVDSLAEIKNNSGIKCGSQQLFGTFVAPEQLWPLAHSPFTNYEMVGYNEKSDIWKAASVCDHFIGDASGSLAARYHLYQLHKLCKNNTPRMRPTAADMIREYEAYIAEYQSINNE